MADLAFASNRQSLIKCSFFINCGRRNLCLLSAFSGSFSCSLFLGRSGETSGHPSPVRPKVLVVAHSNAENASHRNLGENSKSETGDSEIIKTIKTSKMHRHLVHLVQLIHVARYVTVC